MTKNYPKNVNNNHYHLWTDALHARALAHQAINKWDRGTYVHWTITTAWVVLEIACQDALKEPNISYSFKQNLDAAIAKKNLPKLDWGKGIWQKVTKIQELRKTYSHRFISVNNLFPESNLANDTIIVIREAIKNIYIHVGKDSPVWVEDDDDRGWDANNRMMTNLTVIRDGADEDNPNVIKIVYMYKGKEQVSEILPPGIDPTAYVERLIKNVKVPINAIRVYQGDQLVNEHSLRMRGT
ncbi:MAG: hypothetical protein SVZ03_12775 [Spirochaetota bacterium]|nr:hypothetical protein [Spirochaetota bacterium]